MDGLGGGLRERYERAALGVVGVSIIALYAAAFSGVDFAVAARPDAAAPVEAPIPSYEEAARNELPVLTGPAIRDLGGTVKSLTLPVLVPDSGALLEKFDLIDYRLTDVRRGEAEVPRLFLTSLPPDLAAISSTEERKAAFIKLLLPLILSVNEGILENRERAAGLIDRLHAGKRLRRADGVWLESLMDTYGVESGDFDALMLKLDGVPPSLALAQAIEESGWGTSRFAKLGNAIFGQWTLTKGKGIVPLGRSDGKTHEIKAFGHLQESVANYVANLNRHAAYSGFRKLRGEMRENGGEIDGYALAGGLKAYSQRGDAYVRAIREIMRFNDLQGLDGAKLRGPARPTGPPKNS